MNHGKKSTKDLTENSVGTREERAKPWTERRYNAWLLAKEWANRRYQNQTSMRMIKATLKSEYSIA